MPAVIDGNKTISKPPSKAGPYWATTAKVDTAPKTAVPAAPVGPVPTYNPPPSYSPTGGGGGGAAPATPAAPPVIPNFDDWARNDFGYKQTQQENERRLNDFDAETLRGRQTTEADQSLRRTALQQMLQDAGGDWAADSANRGLLRSGLYQQGQDRFVDQRGVEGNQDIDQLMSDFVQQRGSGRIQEQAQGRSAMNDMLSQLSQRYNAQYAGQNAIPGVQ